MSKDTASEKRKSPSSRGKGSMAKGKKQQRRKRKKGPDSVDWRVGWASALAKPVPAAYPGGPSHKAGAVVFTSTFAWDLNGEKLFFTAPSPVALSMNVAIRGARRAESLRATLAYVKSVSPDGMANSVAQPNTPHLFDMFEAYMTTTTFSLLAVEAFCNYFLTARVTEPYRLMRKGREIRVLPADLPRIANLEEKLAVILPEVLGVDTPKGTRVWERFKKLKKARNATVHLKGTDILYAGQDSVDNGSPLASTFLQNDPLDFPRYALQMIGHFGPPKDGGRWFTYAQSKVDVSD